MSTTFLAEQSDIALLGQIYDNLSHAWFPFLTWLIHLLLSHIIYIEDIIMAYIPRFLVETNFDIFNDDCQGLFWKLFVPV